MGPKAAGFPVTGREKEFLPVVGGASFHIVTPREAEQLVSEHSRGEPWAGKKKAHRIILKSCQCRLRFLLCRLRKIFLKLGTFDIIVPYVNIKIFYFAKTFSLFS